MCLAYIKFPKSIYYEFEKGDTIKFKYDANGLPFAQILNRNTLKFDLNFDHDIKITKPLEKFEYYKRYGTIRNQNEQNKYDVELEKYFKTINWVLDSLRNNNLISPDIYYLQKGRIKFLNINLKKEEINFDTIDKSNLKKDNLLYLKTYRYFLENYALHAFSQKNKKDNSLTSVSNEIVFDSILHNKSFSNRTKKYLLYYFLQKIIKTSDAYNSKKYFSKFKSKIKDSSLLNLIKNKYLLDFTELKIATQKVHLITQKKEKTTLQNLIDQNRGKLVYIDFWASWCAPCRSSIPASEMLHKEFKDKKVAFIYISIDKNFNEWIHASSEENLLTVENNLLSINYPKADFYKELKLTSIPRYLMYNKNGELIHQNAPGPIGNEIRNLFNEYLRE